VQEGGIAFGVQRDLQFSWKRRRGVEIGSSTVDYCVGPGDVSACLHLEKVESRI